MEWRARGSESVMAVALASPAIVMNHYLRRELTQARATGLDLPDPLKTLGTYKVAIKVYPGMSPEGTIVVEPKG
jgi:hypothetical protein